MSVWLYQNSRPKKQKTGLYAPLVRYAHALLVSLFFVFVFADEVGY